MQEKQDVAEDSAEKDVAPEEKKQWFKRTRDTMKKNFPNVPAPAWAMIALIILSLIPIIHAEIRENMDNRALREKLESYPQVQPSQLLSSTTSGKVATLTLHEVQRKNGSRAQLVEARLKSGKHQVTDRTGDATVSDEITKSLTAAALKTATPIKEHVKKKYMAPPAVLPFMLTILTALVLMMPGLATTPTWRPTGRDRDIRLDDVIGNREVKRLLGEVAIKLVRQREGTLIGAPPPRGIMLTGDPGVGKTLLAKAFANEIKATLFTCTGADFAEMFVGVGASRARSLFREARKAAPSVIFIDEIDALGSREGMGSDSERRSVINTFLSEMDGVNGNSGVLLIGATNFAESVDSALRRPGRFDRIIHIPLPDTETRAEMLERFVQSVPTQKGINMRELALRTPGYSPAQLQSMVNEAAAIAERRAETVAEKPLVTRDDLCQAQENLMLGIQEIASTGEDLMRVAVHELGHALVGHMLCPEIHVEKITVRGRGQALGYASSRQSDDRRLLPRAAMSARLSMYLAGRQAELEILGDVTSGHADDLRKANDLAFSMVAELGMGRRTGLVVQIQGVSQDTLAEDVRELLADAEAEAGRIIRTNTPWIKDKAARLMIEETLDHDALFADLPAAPRQRLPAWAAEQVAARLAAAPAAAPDCPQPEHRLE